MIPNFTYPIVNHPQGTRVSSGWGEDRSYRGAGKVHNGFDFPAPVGTPVKAIADGVVIAAGDTAPNPAGLMLVIEHAGGWISRYLHLSAFKVSKGQRVYKGQLVALSGSSGIKQSAAHLHFDIRVKPEALATYVARFGKPHNTQFPGDSVSGGVGVPSESLIPANIYDDRVKANAAKLGLVLRGSEGGLTTLLLLAVVAWMILRR